MFRDQLKKLRKMRGISQMQLAEAAKVGKSTVGMWEVGRNEPDLATLIWLADYFEVTLDELVGREVKQAADASPTELDAIMRFRKLDSYGKSAVRAVLSIESLRISNVNISED